MVEMAERGRGEREREEGGGALFCSCDAIFQAAETEIRWEDRGGEQKTKGFL